MKKVVFRMSSKYVFGAIAVLALLLVSAAITGLGALRMGGRGAASMASAISISEPQRESLEKRIDTFLSAYRQGRSCSEPEPNRVFHSLRVHPPGAKWSIDDKGCWSITSPTATGPVVLEILLNSDRFLKAGGRTRPVTSRAGRPIFPYAYSEQGVVFSGGQSHANQFLMFLAEMEVPETHSLVASEVQTYTVRDAVDVAKRNVACGGGQLSWTIPALAHYVGFKSSWTNKFGDQVSTVALVDSMLDNKDTEVHCGRTHYAYALAFAIREAKAQAFAVPTGWHEELAKLIAAAKTQQRSDGSWSLNWCVPEGTARVSEDGSDSALLNVTGHMLEWLSLCPDELPSMREMIDRGAAWIADAASIKAQVDADFIYDEALSHAAHGLAMYRGHKARTASIDNH